MTVRTWEACEQMFIIADTHKPPGHRFEGWKPSQTAAYELWVDNGFDVELLFFPTGEGKSKTSLAIMACAGVDRLLVIAPKATHRAWLSDALTLGLNIDVVNIETFRRDTFRPKRNTAVIFDEFHQAGGRAGLGWQKFKRLRTGFSHIIMCSATPNYNDAERVYCALVIGDPSTEKRYDYWLRDNCNTVPNRFAYYPDVDKIRPFQFYDNAIDFLRAQPWVAYVEDTATWNAQELELQAPDLEEFNTLGFSRRHHRIMNSDMETRHKRAVMNVVDEDGFIRDEYIGLIWEKMLQHSDSNERWLVFCMHVEVGKAFVKSAEQAGRETFYVDGDTKDLDAEKEAFIRTPASYLVGTTALATGTDGIDKVCHKMLILDDIEGDDAKRRQLIGRILPRGAADSAERTVVTVTFK